MFDIPGLVYTVLCPTFLEMDSHTQDSVSEHATDVSILNCILPSIIHPSSILCHGQVIVCLLACLFLLVIMLWLLLHDVCPCRSMRTRLFCSQYSEVPDRKSLKRMTVKRKVPMRMTKMKILNLSVR